MHNIGFEDIGGIIIAIVLTVIGLLLIIQPFFNKKREK